MTKKVPKGNPRKTALMKNELKKYLGENGIGTLIQWGGLAIHDIENYRLNSKSTFDNTA